MVNCDRQPSTGIIIASIAANVGMFLERYFIVIGGLRVPLNPYEPASYFPTWIEWSLMLTGIAIFALLITILTKILPIVAVWELREEEPGVSPEPDATAVEAPA